MTTYGDKPDPSKSHDPHKPVECDLCDATAKPKGGVSFQRLDQRLHISFQLPPGWSFLNCTLRCRRCSAHAIRRKSPTKDSPQ